MHEKPVCTCVGLAPLTMVKYYRPRSACSDLFLSEQVGSKQGLHCCEIANRNTEVVSNEVHFVEYLNRVLKNL